jgi:hypothetical protein
MDARALAGRAGANSIAPPNKRMHLTAASSFAVPSAAGPRLQVMRGAVSRQRQVLLQLARAEASPFCVHSLLPTLLELVSKDRIFFDNRLFTE